VWAPASAQIILCKFWIPVVGCLMPDTCTAVHALNGGVQGQAVRRVKHRDGFGFCYTGNTIEVL